MDEPWKEGKTGFQVDKWYYLLQFEDMFVEKVLKRFICKIDAQLLKTILDKILKPENVQDRDYVLVLLSLSLFART